MSNDVAIREVQERDQDYDQSLTEREIQQPEFICADALDKARKQLVGTDLNSPLVSFTYLRGDKGIQITDEKSVPTFDRLVRQGKPMIFGEAVSGRDEFDPNLPPPIYSEVATKDLAPRHVDEILTTTHPAQKLHQRLMNTERDARLYQEERGANSMYLALGMVHWTDKTEGKKHRAPVLLLPVELERKSASKKFKLAYKNQELEDNIALRKRFKEEFQVDLPELPDLTDIDLQEYYRKIKQVLKNIPGCSLHPDEQALGLFSFGRHLMYKDLDPNNWPEDRAPEKHPIIQSIFGGRFVDEGPAVDPSKRIDDVVNPAERFDVLNVDSSQLRVMEEIRRGKSLRVWGPPGTGKSTSIVNIIANAIAQGQKILFVSEKQAALRVVKAWLDTAGIGAVALEAHSDATRKSIAKNLNKTLALGNPQVFEREKALHVYEAMQGRLNNHVDMLRKQVRDSGFTAYEAITECCKERKLGLEMPKYSYEQLAEWKRADFEKAESYAKSIEHFIIEYGNPTNNTFYGAAVDSLSIDAKQSLQKELEQCHSLASDVRKVSSDLFKALGLAVGAPQEVFEQTLEVLGLINTIFTDNGKLVEAINFDNDQWLSSKASFYRRFRNQLNYAERADLLQGAIDWEELAKADLHEAKACLEAHSNKFFKLRALDSDYKAAHSILSRITKVPRDLEKQKRLVEKLVQLQELQETCVREIDWFSDLFESEISNKDLQNLSFWQQKTQSVVKIQEFVERIRQHPERERLIEIMKHPSQLYKQEDQLCDLKATYSAYKAARATTYELLNYDAGYQRTNFSDQDIRSQEKLLGQMRFGLETLDQLVSFNAIIKDRGDLDLKFLVDEVASCDDVNPQIANQLRRVWFEGLVEEVYQSNQLARDFDSDNHERMLQRFLDADSEVLHANAIEVAKIHAEGMPKLRAAGQSKILFDEAEKKSGHIPFRQLCLQAPDALQAAKPVFMMSPQAIAQHLDPNALQFDLVIFDETSQVRPQDALGAILRGKQFVAFGDLKQLGPTSFFDSGASFTYELEEGTEEQVESILELVEKAGMPERSLMWHYRSKSPDLIHLSNKEFYGGKLKIFPRPKTEKDDKGLVYHHIPHGVYERGKRVNRAEASAVAHAVIDHARTRPHESLGVAALNRTQMDLINKELEILRRKHPEYEQFFQDHKGKEFFVKNLESVQGQERGRIFISVGYGRDEDGKLSLNFGPISQKTGRRRLNTLITRAEQKCEIFTSLSPEEKDFQRSESKGVQFLQKILVGAKYGVEFVYEEETEVERQEDQFCLLVKEYLEEAGLTVDANVGEFGSGVDIVVKHPKQPECDLLGIQIDGLAYQSIDSARDRDRIRTEALEYRNWNLMRSWCFDWLDDPKGEIRRIKKEVKRLVKEQSKVESSVQSSRPIREIERKHKRQLDYAVAVPYQKTDLDLGDLRSEYDQSDSPSLSGFESALLDVIEQESPIHSEMAFRRVRDGLGFSRKSERLERILKQAESELISKGACTQNLGFLYSKSEKTVVPRDRSEFKGGQKKFNLIAPEEIQAAIIRLAKYSFGVMPASLPEAVAEVFGFKTTPRGADALIKAAAEELVEQKVLELDRGFLRLVKK